MPRNEPPLLPAQIPLDLPHQPSWARDDLIVTGSNALAVAAIDGWPQWHHPVLLVIGPPGSGKTHLAAAWRERTGATGPEDVREGSGVPFAVAVDDVDSGHRPEERLFQLINAARLGAGTVLATSRRAPGAMDLRLPDLISRLRAATMVELGAPDDALLEGVLAKLFADRQLFVQPHHLTFLARRMQRSLEAARRLVALIDREALAAKGRVSRSLLQRALQQTQQTAAVSRHAGVTEARYDRAEES